MKGLAAISLAVAVLGLSPAASAQTRVPGPHADTAAALKCLLDHDHGQKGCDRSAFIGSATRPAQFWLWWTPEKDLKLGPLLSSEYAGREAVNGYTTKFLNGRTADVYDVRFAHQKMTFYIVPPGPDGKVRYLHFRDGTPDDENIYLFRG